MKIRIFTLFFRHVAHAHLTLRITSRNSLRFAPGLASCSILKRTETKWQARHQAVAAEGQTGECRSKMWKENHLQQRSPSPKFWTG